MKTECIEWDGALSENGYGRFRFGGMKKKIFAHRRSWELTYGDVPPGLFVLHRCDNRKCFNPEHLFLGTHSDNMHDMKIKGRRKGKSKPQFGEDNPCNKLTATEVHEIRYGRLVGVSQETLASLFKINQSHVSIIEHGKVWVA